MGGALRTASDWSKFYANHLVTSLIDSCQSKWANQKAECRRKVCDWLKVTCHDGQVCEPIRDKNRGVENGIGWRGP